MKEEERGYPRIEARDELAEEYEREERAENKDSLLPGAKLMGLHGGDSLPLPRLLTVATDSRREAVGEERRERKDEEVADDNFVERRARLEVRRRRVS